MQLHKTIVNTSTIRWMRNKVKPEIIAASLTNLLLEKEKKQPLLLQIINNQHLLKTLTNDEVFDHTRHLHIKPEMFFNTSTLQKIYQIRDIFYEFDEDRSRTLEIGELHKMFNTNSIPITEAELVEIFGKGKRKKIEEYKLSFYDIVMFSLSEKEAVRFRNLMNRIKRRVKKGVYIPLTFNSALEYIYNKGQIKRGFDKINKGIKSLDRFAAQFRNTEFDRGRNSVLNMLNRFGVGRSNHLKQVCKGFTDIIEISKNQMHKVCPESFEVKDDSKRIEKYSRLFGKQMVLSTISRSRNNNTIQSETDCHIKNTKMSLPVICHTETDYKHRSASKIYHKSYIKFICPSMKINDSSRKTDVGTASQCTTDRW